MPRISQLKTAGGWGSAQASIIQPRRSPWPRLMYLLPIPCSSARNKAWLPAGLRITEAITSAITSSVDKRLDLLSTCAAGHREPLRPRIAITITAELFLAISPQRMHSICISLSSQRLSHSLEEFNYHPELKLCLMSFKLGSSFGISHEKVDRQMNGAVQRGNFISLGKWG